MGVYFGRLFELMLKRGIKQETLCRACNISTKTLAGMRQGGMPSLVVLDKICNYLDCDFNDIMKHVKNDVADPLIGKQHIYNRTQACGVYRVALKEYMQKTGITLKEVSELSSLSVNTIKSLLVGKIISLNSCEALIEISEDFNILVNKKIRLFQQGISIENSAIVVARNKIEKFAGNPDTVALLKQAVINYMKTHRLEKKSYCERVGISIKAYENLMNNKAVIYSVVRKILDKLSDRVIIEIAECIDDTKPRLTLNNKFRPRNCNKCPAFDKERKECKLLYQITQKDNDEYYSAETCSKPRTHTAVYEEGQARNIEFKKPENVIYIPAKLGRWDED